MLNTEPWGSESRSLSRYVIPSPLARFVDSGTMTRAIVDVMCVLFAFKNGYDLVSKCCKHILEAMISYV